MNHNYTIEVVDHQYIINNEKNISDLLAIAFNGSQFNSKYTVISPFEQTLKMSSNPPRKGIRHIISFNVDQEIIGALFSIDTICTNESYDANCGWFFTVPSLEHDVRKEIAHSLWDKGHKLMKDGGLKRVVTKMGTEAGARFLAEHFGYVNNQTDIEVNCWIHDLGD